MASILIVEDEQRTAEIVALYLRHDGHEVEVCGDGQEAWRRFSSAPADLVVLDWMLPGLDGPTLCRRMRESGSDVRIVLLTARAAEDDRIQGLDAGADDYVCKPFSPRELAARVRALLRRGPAVSGAGRSADGARLRRWAGLAYDPSSRRLSVGGRPVSLTRTELDLLVLLLDHPSRVFTRTELIDRALGADYRGADRTVDAHIGNLRRKLSAMDPSVQPVETVFGIGYRLAPEPEVDG